MRGASALAKPCAGEILVCVLGLAASLVPFLVYTDPFWGVNAFAERALFDPGDAKGVLILKVEPGSPAALAGLEDQDQVVGVDGKPARFATFRETLEAIRPGQPVTFEVRRGGQDLRLEFTGEPPALEGVLLLDWQFISAPVFLVLLLLFIATQPLDPPLWRAILATLGGLAVSVVAVVVEVAQAIPYTIVWRSKGVAHGPSPGLHYAVMAAATLAGLALAIGGALAVRAVLLRRSEVVAASNSLSDPIGHHGPST